MGNSSTPRPVSGRTDIRGIQQLASRLWPLGWHPGGLGWALARGELAEEVVVLDGGDHVVGWAARDMDGPGYLLAQIAPDHPEAAEAAVAWLVSTSGAGELRIEVADGDEALHDAVTRVGFSPHPGDGDVVALRRPALDEPVRPPDGYAFRSVEPGETNARVEVHRAAWLPAALPPGALHRPVEPGATSSFDVAAYRAVRNTWLYSPSFDLVAAAPDGTLAACCIAWYDPATGVAEIEPMGVVPEHRGRGLAAALCLEVARRVGAEGGNQVFINTGPRREYPAPGRAYAKAGFDAFVRACLYVRPGSSS